MEEFDIGHFHSDGGIESAASLAAEENLSVVEVKKIAVSTTGNSIFCVQREPTNLAECEHSLIRKNLIQQRICPHGSGHVAKLGNVCTYLLYVCSHVLPFFGDDESSCDN